MSKKLVTVAMGVALTLPLAVQAANSGPTVYGKLAAGYHLADNGVVDQWEMSSYSSRIGFKGTADLSGGLEGIYQIERGIDLSGESQTVSQRPSFVGLKSDFGTIMAGTMDTPFKLSAGKAEMFADVNAELSGVADPDITGVLTKNKLRMENALGYLSPKFSGMEFRLQFAPGERSDRPSTDLSFASEADGPADQASLSFVYDQDGLYGAIAYDSEVQATQGTYSSARDALRLTLGASMGPFSGYLMLEQSEAATVEGADSENGFLVSGSYAIGQTTLKAQFISSDIVSEGGQQISVGVDQALAKKTKLMAFFSTFEDDADSESDILGVGVEHSF